MVQPDQSSLRNQLLRALAPEDFALVGPYLEPVALPKGKVLIEPNQPIEYVYFAESGVASVVALNSDHRPVEIAIVGWEGLVGPSIVLGVDRTPHQSFFQMEGGGYRIATPHLVRALEASRTLHDLLLRYIHVVTVQTAATAMSNGDSVLSERLARWLLMCHDRVKGNELALELWRNLGDDGVRRAAYRGGCRACQNLFERAIRHERDYHHRPPSSV